MKLCEKYLSSKSFNATELFQAALRYDYGAKDVRDRLIYYRGGDWMHAYDPQWRSRSGFVASNTLIMTVFDMDAIPISDLYLSTENKVPECRNGYGLKVFDKDLRHVPVFLELLLWAEANRNAEPFAYIIDLEKRLDALEHTALCRLGERAFEKRIGHSRQAHRAAHA